MKGCYVALITPFKANGKIDTQSLRKLISWHIDQGTDGILCCGATGESVALSDSEKKKIGAICIETAEKKVPIIVGTGSSSTAQTVRLNEAMQKLGATATLVVTPYYNKPTTRGCIAHYREVCSVGLPVIPYYNPKRTGCYLTADTFVEIGAIPGIIAMKDSSGDLTFMRTLKKKSSLPILSGDDDLTFAALKEGAVGAISVIGNLLPRLWKEMIYLTLDGKWEEAKKRFDRYLPLCKALFLETNPQCVKWVAHWFGLSAPSLRLPLLEIEEKTKKALRQKVVQLALPQYRENLLNLERGDR